MLSVVMFHLVYLHLFTYTGVLHNWRC